MDKRKARVAVLVSGGGTNLQAMIDAQKKGIIKTGEISLVISGNPDAFALTRAKNAGIDDGVVVQRILENDSFNFENLKS